MTKTVAFTKMHGAGNDYIYVNTLLYSIPDPAEAARRWSRPHFSIGSDGLVLICPPTTEAADYRMRIFNADGSEAMMCGNASRCIGKYLYEKGMTQQTVIRLECSLIRRQTGISAGPSLSIQHDGWIDFLQTGTQII